jgi:hypothetical protein
LETDLTLIGTTGVEDALQAGVPDTIEALRRGGINVWVSHYESTLTRQNMFWVILIQSDMGV